MTRRFIIPILALLALVAAACGNKSADEVTSQEDDSEGGLAPSEVTGGYLAKVAKDTLDVETGRFEMTMDFSGEFDGTAIDASMTAEGAYDNSVPATQMSMDMGSFMDSMLDMAEASGEDMTGAEMLDGIDWSMETIQIGDTVYVRTGMFAMLGGLLGTEIDDDTWFRADTGDMAGGDMESLTGAQTTGMDPDIYLEFMQGAGEDVEELGTEDIRGTEATGYRVEVSVADAIEAQVDDEAVAEMEEMFEQFGGGEYLELTFPVDIYVDGEGSVRRVVLAMDIADMGSALGMSDADLGGGSMEISVTTDFFDFGEDITIEAPPEDQVQDMEDLMGGMGLEGFGTN